MREVIANFLLGMMLVAAALIFEKTDNSPSWIELAWGVFLAIAVKMLVIIGEEWKRIWLITQSLLHPNKPIRVSMAYLFRIKIDGKYFLIKNHRDQNGYQPVGGVYRYLENENADLFDEIGLIPDHHMPVDKQSRNDLRKQLKQRKVLRKFLKWFDSKKNRETDPWREFYEELLVDGIIDKKPFPYIQYTLCRQDLSNIHRSSKFPIDEFLFADIYELKWENEQQKMEFEKLFQVNDARFVFATPEEINNGFTKDGRLIISHTKKIL